MVRIVPTGRDSETVERYDHTHCLDCGQPLAAPNLLNGWHPCSCAGGGGHVTLRCKACGRVHYEPPHNPALDIGPGHAGTA